MPTIDEGPLPVGDGASQPAPAGAVERADRILVWLCLLTLVFGGLATTIVVFGANAMLAKAARTAGPAEAGEHAGDHPAGAADEGDHAGMNTAGPPASDHMEMHHPAGAPTPGDPMEMGTASPTAAGDHMDMPPAGPTSATDHEGMHAPSTDDGSG